MKCDTLIERARLLSTELEQSLGTRFTIWIQLDGCWHPSDDPSESPHSADQQVFIGRVLQSNQLGPEVFTIPFANNRNLLAVPLCQGERIALVVTGFFSQRDLPLVRRLAAVTLLSLEQRYDLLAANLRVEEYAFQVTNDFEELVWLRNLAEGIEICELENNIVNVAKTTLPTLRILIQAEGIFLFGMPTRPENELITGPLRFYDGDTKVTDDQARTLIQHLHKDATVQPVVRNSARRQFIHGVEGMRNCVLIRLIRSGFESGWLLAVNKKATIDQSQDSLLAASALSHYEFGTFEAGLVNAAGIMLATHSRNLELFREKERLLVGVIRALINAIDAKDAYTCGHSDRVATMSKRIAQQLGLSDLECENIYMAGVLHDIGKIGVPDRVLGKPDKLTEEEFRIIKTHPEIGAQILKHLDSLSYVLPGVLYHHEMVNGNGYPKGLAGDQIPLMGRILAVADAYDAMTSDRPYRKGMPAEKAENILRGGAGKQWDPLVVNAFFDVLPDIHEICGTAVETPVRCALPLSGEESLLPRLATNPVTPNNAVTT